MFIVFSKRSNVVTCLTCQTRLLFGSNRIHDVGVVPSLLQGVDEEEDEEVEKRGNNQ